MILPPEVAHERPVPDSRGLSPRPGYAAEGAPRAATAPCLTCGAPAPVVPYRYATGRPYGACPAQEAEACVQRARARAAAQKAAQAAAAAIAGSARAREEIAAEQPPRRRETLLGQAGTVT